MQSGLWNSGPRGPYETLKTTCSDTLGSGLAWFEKPCSCRKLPRGTEISFSRPDSYSPSLVNPIPAYKRSLVNFPCLKSFWLGTLTSRSRQSSLRSGCGPSHRPVHQATPCYPPVTYLASTPFGLLPKPTTSCLDTKLVILSQSKGSAARKTSKRLNGYRREPILRDLGANLCDLSVLLFHHPNAQTATARGGCLGLNGLSRPPKRVVPCRGRRSTVPYPLTG